jgi:hypothetical protein
MSRILDIYFLLLLTEIRKACQHFYCLMFSLKCMLSLSGAADLLIDVVSSYKLIRFVG